MIGCSLMNNPAPCTPLARFQRTLLFEAADRLPLVEWAPRHPHTCGQWYAQGLPRRLKTKQAIDEYLGLDPLVMEPIQLFRQRIHHAPQYETGLCRDLDSYRQLRPCLFPDPAFDRNRVAEAFRAREEQRVIFCIQCEGFFSFASTLLLGPENLLLAMVDSPELIHMISSDLSAFIQHVLTQIFQIGCPVAVILSEDMCCNSGPLMSQRMYAEFFRSRHRKLTGFIRDAGSFPIMDSDGDVTDFAAWIKNAGFQGILPLEKNAGTNPAEIRTRNPDLVLIGGIGHSAPAAGSDAVKSQLRGLKSVIRTGGMIPCLDHQTPPGVSLADYRTYVALVKKIIKTLHEQTV